MPNDADTLPCLDKLSFESKKQAEGAKVTAAHRYGSRLYVYKCNYCGLWHIATVVSDE
ncbi:MAG: hypothetical protein MUF85_03435 [Patescibacteria group bacterium]|jgi:hypothetical protein|nr:hypothetical protein [Patescibacteria group bacterium]